MNVCFLKTHVISLVSMSVMHSTLGLRIDKSTVQGQSCTNSSLEGKSHRQCLLNHLSSKSLQCIDNSRVSQKSLPYFSHMRQPEQSPQKGPAVDLPALFW